MLPYAIKDLWRWLMPIGGSSLISLLGVLSGPGAEFFVVWWMLFSFF